MVVPEGGSLLYMNETHDPRRPHRRRALAAGAAALQGRRRRSSRRARSATRRRSSSATAACRASTTGISTTNVWENERLLTFTPREVVDARSRRRTMAPEDDFNHVADRAAARSRSLDAGGSVQLGAHGQLQGLGAHWELWMLQQGGMTPLEALRVRDDRRRALPRPRQRHRLAREGQARRPRSCSTGTRSRTSATPSRSAW